MKKLAKLFLLVLVFALMASVLVACGEDKTTTDEPSTPTGAPDESTNIHAFGEWKVITNPTCTAKGLKKRVCECGEEEKEEIKALGHNYVDGICTRCGDELVETKGLTFSLKKDDTYEVTGYTGGSGEVVILSAHDGKAVTSIGENAFRYRTNLTSITIPDSVTSIGSYAFYECHSLTSITIPDSVTSIGEHAFNGCSKLTSITIPDSVTSIGEYAFYDCSSLQYNEYDNGYYLGNDNNPYIILVNVKATSCTIHEDTKLIYSDAFMSYSLTSITIPDSVTSIGSNAFRYCSSLQYNEYDNGYYLGNDNNPYLWLIKAKDTSITSCTIHENTKFIYEYAFDSCSSLTSITIPDSVTSIGDSAFSSCSRLTSITLGNSVTSIGESAFINCSRLTSVYYTGDIASWCGIRLGDNPLIYAHNLYIDNEIISGEIVLPNTVTEIPDYTFKNSNITSITISDSVTSIGSNAFYNCSTRIIWGSNPTITLIGSSAFKGWNGTSIIIPDSVTSIGNSAFYNCSSLTSITIGDSVTSIGEGAFYNCPIETATIPTFAISYIPKSNLKTVVITSGESIKSNAFSNCSNLTSITLGNSVTSIGYDAFRDCRSLTSVYYTGDIASWCGITFSGYYSNPLRYAHNLYIDNEIISGEIVLPNTVTKIPDYTFKNSIITSITISDSVTSIGSYAFSDCSKLTSITIPDGVASIGDSAFSNCSSLTSITILDSVTSIGNSAFSNCSSLTSITIGNSVTSIGDYAFENCPIETATIPTLAISCIPKGNLKTVVITSGESIKSNAFSSCSSLTSITIPDSVTSIGYQAFDGCSSLTSVTIGNSVTSIGDYAFRGCSSLQYNEYDNGYYLGNEDNPYLWLIKAKNTSITSCMIHENTKFIHGSAFYNCNSLKSVTIGNSVTSIGDSAFYKCSSLTSIKIPDSVTSIGGSAFYKCSSLTSITIPDSVTSIGSGAFEYCSKLTSITIPDSVTSIGHRAFEYCNSLTSVYYTGDIASWCGITFDWSVWNYETSNPLGYAHNLYIDNELIKDIVIPDTVTEIKANTFNGWNGTSITIPDSVTSIGEYAFNNCSSLTSITIPDSVTSIGERAFSYCSNLMSITIPDSVTSIGSNAFYNCSTRIIWGSKPTITLIGSSAFKGWNGTSITIPDSVTSIGGGAFYGCSRLMSVTLGNGLKGIGDNAFYDCKNLVEVYNKSSLNITKGSKENGYVGYYAKDIYTGDDAGKLTTDSNGYVIYTDGEEKILRGYSGTETNLILPEGITQIDQYAFSNYSGLTNITISNSVKSIGVGAFSDCSARIVWGDNPTITTIGDYAFNGWSGTSIMLPNSVMVIGKYAFSSCSNLTSITIPDSVTSIWEGAFHKCSGLTSLVIGNGVTSIGNVAFSGCSSLTSVSLGRVTSIGGSAFSGCNSLVNIAIPDSVTSIGDSAFSNCSSLKSIKIPAGVAKLTSQTFSGCSSLTEVTIPNSVKNIGNYVFSNCSKLRSIIFQGTKNEWNWIGKSNIWDSNTENYTVHCTDGDISK